MAKANKITIIDIMNGIHKLGLYNKIPAPEFRFLIGLLCKANELGFKREITLSIADAMCLGGGNSRQSVNRLRTSLEQIDVEGDKLLKVTHGWHFKNVAAKYVINYELLTKQNDVWKKDAPSPSQNNDGNKVPSQDSSQMNDGNEDFRHRIDTNRVTFPRSEVEEEKTTTTGELPVIVKEEPTLSEVVVGFIKEYGITQGDTLLTNYCLEYLSYMLEQYKFNDTPKPGLIFNQICDPSNFSLWEVKFQYNRLKEEIAMDGEHSKVHWYYPPTEGGK